MAIPAPRPGLVVRYDYLWSHEQAKGRIQGKDRPACLVAASDNTRNPRFVVLLPITHTPPTPPAIGIEIPAQVKKALGLDDEPSWVIVTEYNVDAWPSQGLSPISSQTTSFAYGFIPPGLFAKVKAAFGEAAKSSRSRRVTR